MNVLESITCTLSDVKEFLWDAIANTKEALCDFFDDEMCVTRKSIFIICTISGLIGILYGFLISPVKKGIQVNVNKNKNYYNDDESDWE